METENKKIVEINGLKMELDMRSAQLTNVDTYKVGDQVKVLIKEYSDNYKSYAGIIVGFDQFKERPTILVAYLKTEYNSASIQIVNINKDTKDVEICLASDCDLPVNKETALSQMNKSIENAEATLLNLKQQKEYFINMFGRYFDK